MGMHKGFTHGAASVSKEQMEKRFGHGPAKPQQFLREYIEQKQAGLIPACDCSQKDYNDGYHHRSCSSLEKKKLTFHEWYLSVEMQTYDKTEYDCMEMAWNAAQENK